MKRGRSSVSGRATSKRAKTGLPWVILKAAITLDGKLATSTGDSRWVSGGKARQYVHRLRDQVDAILVGANTARLDNPQLTTRLPRKRGRNAVRVVLDSRLQLPTRLKIFASPLVARTIVVTLRGNDAPAAKKLIRRGVEVWEVYGKGGRVNLLALLRRLGAEGFSHLLVEGGAETHGSFLEQGLADELLVFIAPKLVGSRGLSWTGRVQSRRMSGAVELEEVVIRPVGSDVLLRGLLGNRRWKG
jgi:diaminohydroxyphosphoribosylaminopyrimidine deaminase/5-amino-6-(5-phosphoribosylamino)uracil reductase